MNTKQIVGIIALILMIPSFIGLLVFSLNIGTQGPEENTQDAANLLADSVTP